MKNILSTQETVRLCELERVIQKGKDTFVEVGAALAEIRDSKIYRATFKTFEDYCQERWNFSRVRAHQMIEAAKAVVDVKSSLHGIPQTSVQAEKLAKAPPEKRAKAWDLANNAAKEEGKPVAARHVEAAVAEVMPKDEPDPVVVDGVKFALPNPSLSAESRAKGEEAERESEKLWLLKSTWKTTNKKDRALFLEWASK